MISVLNNKQLRRIEGIHRGFLYQHLYAVGCLLLAPSSGAIELLVEKDEDIELLLTDHHLYIQVRTRSHVFSLSDINDFISRIQPLREAHIQGKRPLVPQFFIIINQKPGPELLEMIQSGRFSNDIYFIWPNQDGEALPLLPPAWKSITEAINWCVEIAETIPWSRLSGETIIWKLAALIQFACTGTPPRQAHRFTAEELPTLFEQIIIQLQSFPEPPKRYQLQESEPDLQVENRVRLIVGFSGSGKTAWASQAALHTETPIAYFDVGDTPETALASSISRELSAHFIADKKQRLGSIFLPGASGMDTLRALDIALSEKEIQLTLFIDNAHRIEAKLLNDIISLTSSIKWVILAQPSPNLNKIESYLNVHSEVLKGWSQETIAAEFAVSGCVIDPQSSLRIRNLTGGMPLFVKNAVHLTITQYDGLAKRFCDSIEKLTHVSRTAQEIILSDVYNTLSNPAKEAAALLSLCGDVSITKTEVSTLLSSSLQIEPCEVFLLLRELTDWAILQQLVDGSLKIHDAFRLIANDDLSGMNKIIGEKAQSQLITLLEESLRAQFDVGRIRLYLRLLSSLGDITKFINVVTSVEEFLFEMGLAKELASILETHAASGNLKPKDLFWALDTLVFWHYQNREYSQYESTLAQLEEVYKSTNLGKDEKGALLLKQMQLNAMKGNLRVALSLLDEMKNLFKEDPEYLRIIHYDFALGLYQNKNYSESELILIDLIEDYYHALGLMPEDVIAKNPPEIEEKLGDCVEKREDLKRLADVLDLYARVVIEQGRSPGLARIHAFKFYTMAHAVTSAVKTGQDVIDDFLGPIWDPQEARNFIEESLLPAILHYKLTDYLIPVKSQYAVVLAYCGDPKAAQTVIKKLEPFWESMSEESRREFENQRGLIQEIISGRVSPPPSFPPFNRELAYDVPDKIKKRKIGRNKPCPCGSGRKFKKCCGR